ncbi:hypothetical protein AB1E18_009306 [Capra hircus]
MPAEHLTAPAPPSPRGPSWCHFWSEVLVSGQLGVRTRLSAVVSDDAGLQLARLRTRLAVTCHLLLREAPEQAVALHSEQGQAQQTLPHTRSDSSVLSTASKKARRLPTQPPPLGSRGAVSAFRTCWSPPGAERIFSISSSAAALPTGRACPQAAAAPAPPSWTPSPARSPLPGSRCPEGRLPQRGRLRPLPGRLPTPAGTAACARRTSGRRGALSSHRGAAAERPLAQRLTPPQRLTAEKGLGPRARAGRSAGPRPQPTGPRLSRRPGTPLAAHGAPPSPRCPDASERNPKAPEAPPSLPPPRAPPPVSDPVLPPPAARAPPPSPHSAPARARPAACAVPAPAAARTTSGDAGLRLPASRDALSAALAPSAFGRRRAERALRAPDLGPAPGAALPPGKGCGEVASLSSPPESRTQDAPRPERPEALHLLTLIPLDPGGSLWNSCLELWCQWNMGI